jgi:hypothetical protein
MPFAGCDGFVVRIFLGDNVQSSVGMGFVVGDQQVVTCAHVVNTALGRDQYAQDQPGPEALLKIGFPLLGDDAGDTTRDCRVERWLPPHSPGTAGGDVAGLVIVDGGLPHGAGLARLILADRVSGAEVGVFGYSSQGRTMQSMQGAWVTLRLRGAVGHGDLQLDTETESAFKALPGYSGSPVVAHNQDGDAVAGMLSAAYRADAPGDLRDAYAVPAGRIAAAWPDVLGDLLAPPAPSGVASAGIAGPPLAPAPSGPPPPSPLAAVADPGVQHLAQQPTEPQQGLPQPSLPQVIAGNWTVDVQSPQGGSFKMMLALMIPPSGQPQFEGTFVGTPMPMQVGGYWMVMGSQIRLTGVQTVAGVMPMRYPYDVMVTFASWSYTQLIGVSSNGERVVWQRQN